MREVERWGSLWGRVESHRAVWLCGEHKGGNELSGIGDGCMGVGVQESPMCPKPMAWVLQDVLFEVLCETLRDDTLRGIGFGIGIVYQVKVELVVPSLG